jgi:hypothetical protein
MTLEKLLTALVSDNSITVNLYDEKGLLLITFGHPGYDSLDDELLTREVSELEIQNVKSIRVKLAEVASSTEDSSNTAETSDSNEG